MPGCEEVKVAVRGRPCRSADFGMRRWPYFAPRKPGKKVFVHCRRRPHGNGYSSVPDGRTGLDCGGSAEGNGGIWCELVPPHDLSPTVVLRKELSRAISGALRSNCSVDAVSQLQFITASVAMTSSAERSDQSLGSGGGIFYLFILCSPGQKCRATAPRG
jgi:hypothetical protein